MRLVDKLENPLIDIVVVFNPIDPQWPDSQLSKDRTYRLIINCIYIIMIECTGDEAIHLTPIGLITNIIA